MSRAFVRETDQDAGPALPERAVSAHRNLVTPAGLRQIEARLRELEAARQAARRQQDAAGGAAVERDLRYWTQRRASAELVDLPGGCAEVRFGSRVTLHLQDGSERCFQLVGEDEADPAAGLLSWTSPVAQALLGCEVDAEVELMGRPAQIARIE